MALLGETRPFRLDPRYAVYGCPLRTAQGPCGWRWRPGAGTGYHTELARVYDAHLQEVHEAEQLDLGFALGPTRQVRPSWATGDDIWDEWWQFHLDHPDVYGELIVRARRLLDRGCKRIGIGMLWEVLRYETLVGATSTEAPVRLNNDFRSRYARLLIDREPELADVIETRALRPH